MSIYWHTDQFIAEYNIIFLKNKFIVSKRRLWHLFFEDYMKKMNKTCGKQSRMRPNPGIVNKTVLNYWYLTHVVLTLMVFILEMRVFRIFLGFIDIWKPFKKICRATIDLINFTFEGFVYCFLNTVHGDKMYTYFNKLIKIW